jgi:hypothetical protein
VLSIRIDAAAREAGFAPLLTELTQQNVEQHPARRADFDRLPGTIAIQATDIETALTMDVSGGALVVHDGVRGGPDVVISTNSFTVLELSNARLRFGLPDPCHPSGRAVLWKMRSGELKVSGPGLVSKPLLLPRFSKLLSVVSA